MKKIAEAGDVPYQEVFTLLVDMKIRPIYFHLLNRAVPPGSEGKAQRDWKDYELVVKDLQAVVLQGIASNTLTIEMADQFQPGSVWTSQPPGGTNGPKMVLIVVERTRDGFKSRLVTAQDPLRLLLLAGKIKNGRIEWRGQDVVAAGKAQTKKAARFPDQSGVLEGETLTLSRTVKGNSASGDLVLRLMK